MYIKGNTEILFVTKKISCKKSAEGQKYPTNIPQFVFYLLKKIGLLL